MKSSLQRHLGCLLLLAISIAETGCRAIGRFSESRQTIASRRLSRQGLKAMHEGDWSVAENHFSNALEVSASDDRAHWGLAESLWQRGERPAAIQHMEQAVRLSAGDPKLAERLGRMYLEVGRLEESIEQCNFAMQSERRSAEVWALRGDCLFAKGQNDESLAAYHRALAIQPDFPNVQLKAAEIYFAQGRFDRLIATLDCMQEGVGAEQIPARADLLRGIAMQQLGRSDEARQCFTLAASKEPSDPTPHLQLATLLLNRGDFELARASLATAVHLDPLAGQNTTLIQQLNGTSSIANGTDFLQPSLRR